MEVRGTTNMPSESASIAATALPHKKSPLNTSFTIPLQKLASLFSQPVTSIKQEPMEEGPVSHAPQPRELPSTVHVEVCQTSLSMLRGDQVRELVERHLMEMGGFVKEMVQTEFEDEVLTEHVMAIAVTDVPGDKFVYYNPSTNLVYHVYKLHEDGPILEELDEEQEVNVSASTNWMLPSAEFQGLWESLVYDMDIKQKLLRYVETTLLFSDCGVNSTIISWNRVVLLHGPPGTGKTSLCKALAQKLCIRLSERYSYGQLVEINSHSLFSKWFSESGKLVQKMFSKIQELIEDPDALVCVLIDEVESLTAARKASMAGTEPSDAIRVVNALLTQLDQIRRFPNVIILTTSNVTGAIDLAFVDRADIKQFIGFPSPSAIFKIYHSCILELTRVEIVHSSPGIREARETSDTRYTRRLKQIACKSQGLSGRTLRKLPFLALSLHTHTTTPTGLSLEAFLEALDQAVATQLKERQELCRQ